MSKFDYKYYEKQIQDQNDILYKTISNIVYLDIDDSSGSLNDDLMLIVFTDKTIAAYESCSEEEWTGPGFTCEPIPIIHKRMLDAGLVSELEYNSEVDRLSTFHKELKERHKMVSHHIRKTQALEYLNEFGIPEEYEKE